MLIDQRDEEHALPLAGRAIHSNLQDVLRCLKGPCAAHEKGKRPSQGVKK